jgi:transcriptional repressor NrdR
MRCPYCFSDDTQVIDSRETEDRAAVRRRRECGKCGKRCTTYERVELLDIIVTKKDGRREAFDRNKILLGIRKACEKRPIPSERVERAVDEVESELRGMKSSEVQSKAVGKLVMAKLREIDPVAYIRFASVYKSFRTLEAFERELDKLKEDE